MANNTNGAGVFVGDVVADYRGQDRIELRLGGIPTVYIHHISVEDAQSLLSQLSAVLFDHSIREATDEGRVAEAEALMERLTEPF